MFDVITHRKLTKQEERLFAKFPSTDAFLWHNANPHGKITGDCVVRAISTAADLPYEVVLDGLVETYRKTGYHICDDRCYARYLVSIGFQSLGQPKDEDWRIMTGEEYCRSLSRNKGSNIKAIAAHIGAQHICCIKPVTSDSESTARFRVLDTYNSSKRCVGKVWVLFGERESKS